MKIYHLPHMLSFWVILTKWHVSFLDRYWNLTSQIERNKLRAILVTYLRARCDQIDVAGDNDNDGDDDN